MARSLQRLRHPTSESPSEGDRRTTLTLKRAKRNMDVMPPASAIRHAASLDQMSRIAAAGGAGHHTVNHYNNRSETRIGSIPIHTNATDAKGIAADIEPHLHRGQAAGRAVYGLA